MCSFDLYSSTISCSVYFALRNKQLDAFRFALLFLVIGEGVNFVDHCYYVGYEAFRDVEEVHIARDNEDINVIGKDCQNEI